MNIRFGIYDIFSRIVPGLFYIFVFTELTLSLKWLTIDWKTVDWEIISKFSFSISLGLLLAAYIVGTAMDRFGSAWHTFFKKRGMSNRILDEFKEIHKDEWQIEFEDKDWSVLRTYLYIHNPNVADDIDRNNALCIMLRNVSLGLVILAASIVLQFANTLNWGLIALAIFILFLSYQVAIQARTLRGWFYTGIYEAIVAYRLNIEERVKPVKRKKSTK